MNRKHLAALGTSLALVAALTACSSGDAEEPTTENEKTESTDTEAEGGLSNESAEDTPEEDSSADSSVSTGSSDVEILLDGSPVELTDPKVTCATSGDTFVIGVTAANIDAAAGEAFGAILSAGDNPTVSTVALTDPDGMTVAYAEGLGGSADVAVDGDTYTITGEGIGADLSNPTSAENVEFSFTVTCP